MSKRTIEVENNVELSFKYRKDGEELKENAIEVAVVCDLSKLSPEDLMEWAYSAMIVSYQSKLRSKNPPKIDEATGKYGWIVPSRGTRSSVDPEKVKEQAAKLLDKLDDSAKKEMLFLTLMSMGKSEAEATAISGYVKPTAATETKKK